MQSDLRRHREFHNAVLEYHCDVEGCNFSARAMQTVKRHQKVDHQVRITVEPLCIEQRPPKIQHS